MGLTGTRRRQGIPGNLRVGMHVGTYGARVGACMVDVGATVVNTTHETP